MQNVQVNTPSELESKQIAEIHKPSPSGARNVPPTGNVGTDPVSLNPHAQPRSLERFTCPRGASANGRNRRATAAQSLTVQRPPASLECAAAASPLRSSAQRFTGAPLPWPPAPGGSSCFPAQLSSSAKSPQTPLSRVPAGLEHHVQEGKLRNKKPQVPGRHSHAQFTCDTVWGAVTPCGSSCPGVPLLLQQDQHGHGMG